MSYSYADQLFGYTSKTVWMSFFKLKHWYESKITEELLSNVLVLLEFIFTRDFSFEVTAREASLYSRGEIISFISLICITLELDWGCFFALFSATINNNNSNRSRTLLCHISFSCFWCLRSVIKRLFDNIWKTFNDTTYKRF